MRLIRSGDFPEQGWKNGGGRTREIAVQRDAAGVLWRISLADITAPGSFSAFPGLQRIFAVAGGGPVRLRIGVDRIVDIRPGDPPVVFDGAAEVAAELGGEPAQALNLMVRPGHCRAAMDLADADFAPPGWAKAVWVIPSAPCRIRCRGRTIAAGRRDAVSLPAAPFALVGAAPAHVVTIGAASSATHDGPAAAS